MADMGLYGLGVMGQNLALNVCEKGFNISVANRSEAKVDTCVARYEKEILGDEALAADAGKLEGFKDLRKFVDSLKKPRCIMFLVKAGRYACFPSFLFFSSGLASLLAFQNVLIVFFFCFFLPTLLDQSHPITPTPATPTAPFPVPSTKPLKNSRRSWRKAIF